MGLFICFDLMLMNSVECVHMGWEPTVSDTKAINKLMYNSIKIYCGNWIQRKAHSTVDVSKVFIFGFYDLKNNILL